MKERIRQDAIPTSDIKHQPWYVRVVAAALCRSILLSASICLVIARIVGRVRSVNDANDACRVVLTGGFKADGWVDAHVRPLAINDRCQHVWVVTDQPMLDIPKTTYVHPPRWAQRTLGKVSARLILCLITAWRVRPHVVGGFHLLVNGIVAMIAAKLVGGKAVYLSVGGWNEVWGGGSRSENSVFGRLGKDSVSLERRLLSWVRKFDLVLTMGSGAKQFFRKRGVLAPIEVMSGGIDEGRFCQVCASENRDFDIIFIGRLVPVKRLDILLKTVREITSYRSSVRVALVGDGPLKDDLMRLAAKLGIVDNVLFLGGRDDIPNWLSRSKVFVLTSDTEGLSLSLLEASLAGVPAVVSNVGDLSDLIVDGENGWLVERRDVSGFADRIRWLLDHSQEWQQFSRCTREAGRRYSLSAATEKWNSVLDSILGKDRSTAGDLIAQMDSL